MADEGDNNPVAEEPEPSPEEPPPEETTAQCEANIIDRWFRIITKEGTPSETTCFNTCGDEARECPNFKFCNSSSDTNPCIDPKYCFDTQDYKEVPCPSGETSPSCKASEVDRWYRILLKDGTAPSLDDGKAFCYNTCSETRDTCPAKAEKCKTISSKEECIDPKKCYDIKKDKVVLCSGTRRLSGQAENFLGKSSHPLSEGSQKSSADHQQGISLGVAAAVVVLFIGLALMVSSRKKSGTHPTELKKQPSAGLDAVNDELPAL